MVVSKTSDHIQIIIKMPNPSQEPPAASKAPNEDLKDMDVHCTFKIEIQSQHWEHGHIKDQWPVTSEIKIKFQDSSQEPPESSKAQNEDLKYVDVLFTNILNIDLWKTSDNTQIQIKNPNPFQEHPVL